MVTEDDGYHKRLYHDDPSLNIAPDLVTKRDSLLNTIEFFRTIEGHQPNVAVLAATEDEDKSQPATGDAVKLKAMGANGEITGATVAGPFAMDIAISKKSAELKGVFNKAAKAGDAATLKVAGDADILVYPNLESGNILFKSRVYMSDAKVGGLVLGAKVPIILTSRSDSAEARKLSAALALLSVRKAAPPKTARPNP